MSETSALTVDERSARLGHELHTWLRSGFRVEHHTPTDVVLVGGRRVNHILHLLLTLVTFGLWAIVWIFLAAAGGEKRVALHVDQHGQVSKTWL